MIIDTAGRHKLDEELVVELEQISDVANANERFLVIDAQVGQSAGPVAANFHDLAGVTGIVITKLDGTARGGGALSQLLQLVHRNVYRYRRKSCRSRKVRI